MRGGGRARQRTIAPDEDGADPCDRSSAAPNFHQRTDNVSNHVTEEAVASHLVLDERTSMPTSRQGRFVSAFSAGRRFEVSTAGTVRENRQGGLVGRVGPVGQVAEIKHGRPARRCVRAA
jgi:hypothetical protein